MSEEQLQKVLDIIKLDYWLNTSSH